MSDYSQGKKGGRAFCPSSRSMMSLYAKPAHKKASKVLGYALTLDTPEAWFATSAIWQAVLTPEEAATASHAALMATPPELAHIVANEVLGGAGMPLPPLSDVVEDAGWWADHATPEERSAISVACFNRFTAMERDEFRTFVEGR